MKTSNIPQVFEFLTFKKASPLYSVPFCLRLQGRQVGEVAKAAGISRVFFYKALAGSRKPNEGMKRELSALGINPWGE